MVRDDVRRAGEAEFALEELFFSATDRRGFIRSANAVFTRVSGFAPQEWLGAAHNLVRHEDMPRVVFRVLWDRLDRGLPVAAYVKNRTKEGGYYWVLALAFPIGDELFSLRLKPSAGLLETVEGLYRELVAQERAVESIDSRSAAIEASQRSIGAALAGLGFADYEAFMRRALPAEVAARFASLGPSAGRLVATPREPGVRELHRTCSTGLVILVALTSRLEGLERLAGSYRDAARALAELAEEVSMFAVNAGLTAARTGRRSQVLGAIARLMREAAQDIRDEVACLAVLLETGTSHIRSLSFDVSRSALALEVVGQFLVELDVDVDDPRARQDAAALMSSAADSIDEASTRLRDLPLTLASLHASLRRLLSRLRSLRILRIRAEVDSAGDEAAEEFSDIVARVEADLIRGLDHLAELLAATVDAQRIDATSQARALHDHSQALRLGRTTFEMARSDVATVS